MSKKQKLELRKNRKYEIKKIYKSKIYIKKLAGKLLGLYYLIS